MNTPELQPVIIIPVPLLTMVVANIPHVLAAQILKPAIMTKTHRQQLMMTAVNTPHVLAA